MEAEAKLYSLISGLCEGRVYPEEYNQGDAYPGIVYTRTGSETFNTLCLTNEGMRAFIRVEVFAKTLDEAMTISREVIQRCAGECAINNLSNDEDIERGVMSRIIDISVWDE